MQVNNSCFLIHRFSIIQQMKHVFRAIYSLRTGTIYRPQLWSMPYTILAWTAQYVNCHIALKAMFYLLINTQSILYMYVFVQQYPELHDSFHQIVIENHLSCNLTSHMCNYHATYLVICTLIMQLTQSYVHLSCNLPSHTYIYHATYLVIRTLIMQLTQSYVHLSCNLPSHMYIYHATYLVIYTFIMQLTQSYVHLSCNLSSHTYIYPATYLVIRTFVL